MHHPKQKLSDILTPQATSPFVKWKEFRAITYFFPEGTGMEAEGAEAALERHDVCQCCVGPILSGPVQPVVCHGDTEKVVTRTDARGRYPQR